MTVDHTVCQIKRELLEGGSVTSVLWSSGCGRCMEGNVTVNHRSVGALVK